MGRALPAQVLWQPTSPCPAEDSSAPLPFTHPGKQSLAQSRGQELPVRRDCLLCRMETLSWGEEGELEAGTCSGQMEISRQWSPQTLCSGRKLPIWPVILLRRGVAGQRETDEEAMRASEDENGETQVLPSRLPQGTVTVRAGE